MRDTLGDHLFNHFITAKRTEWDSYIRQVSAWEIERYLKLRATGYGLRATGYGLRAEC